MTCRVIAKPIETAEMSGTPTIGQSFTLSSTGGNKVLKGAVVCLCIENPTMTALTLELWSNNGGAPGKLIAASTTSKSRSDLLGGSADNYALGWYGFSFPLTALKAGATYWLVLRCTGYTYTANTHLAWRHDYPDPKYQDGVTMNAVKGAEHPLDVGLIMADL